MYPKIPKEIPAKGYYYHYKHDPTLGVNNYAYEVIGVGAHTEEDCRQEDGNMVIYRPLYDSPVYRAGKMYDLRPIDMWMGDVDVEGKVTKRFSLIGDRVIIAELDRIKQEMYKEDN